MERHLIVTGYPRSGSTMFYNMLRHTLQDFALYEQELPAARLLEQPGNQCTKRPKDVFDVPRLMQLNRGRKRIDLVITLRDPRDTLISRHVAVPDDYFIGADHCYFVPGNRPPQFTDPGLLANHKMILQISASGLFPQGVFFLKYEDLVSDPEAVQQMLGEGLDLRFDGKFSDFHTASIPGTLAWSLNGVRPVEQRRERKWARPEHRARIIDQFTRFPVLHDILFQLGYEDDRGWFEELCAQAAA
ncbi:sulfotransferase domain-containing protein [Salipiger mangrovisoli]|uniref:Sulfotransferase domain-containing protein n=1 Tax=Salipiger mangrovisoli TaxID=2865933 RepID=A0ABR9X814_9RHOB|nr:sulfotransferase domain-containing protein [Salipiger mangrovisoli]MBE9639687.1 sulfotransferase domain-containing protein [Salipiger mangrovisoli]